MSGPVGPVRLSGPLAPPEPRAWLASEGSRPEPAQQPPPRGARHPGAGEPADEEDDEKQRVRRPEVRSSPPVYHHSFGQYKLPHGADDFSFRAWADGAGLLVVVAAGRAEV